MTSEHVRLQLGLVRATFRQARRRSTANPDSLASFIERADPIMASIARAIAAEPDAELAALWQQVRSMLDASDARGSSTAGSKAPWPVGEPRRQSWRMPSTDGNDG